MMKSFTYAYYFFFTFTLVRKVRAGVCMYQVTVMLKD